MPKILTSQHLRDAGMPSWDIETFTKHWPDGCEITPENYKKAEKFGLSPSTLLYAVAKEKRNSWYSSPTKAYYDQMEALLRQKHEREDEQLEGERDDAEIEYQCKLMIDAIFGPD